MERDIRMVLGSVSFDPALSEGRNVGMVRAYWLDRRGRYVDNDVNGFVFIYKKYGVRKEICRNKQLRS